MKNYFIKIAMPVIFLLTGMMTFAAAAADWPDRPITMVIMSREGGGMDQASRLLGDAMAAKLGQPMKYVNRPGASGEIALKSYLNAKDDGYTIFGGNIATLMVMFGSEPKDYDINEGLAWLGSYLVDPAMLITSASSDISSLDDFITKAKVEKQRVGVANWASVQTLALLQLQNETDLQLEIIPYSGFKGASTAILGNHIEAAVGNFSATEKLGDQVRYLGIFSDKIPGTDSDELSIRKQANVDVIDASSLRALGVHRALKTAHPDRYDALNTAFSEVIADPAFIESFMTIGADPAQSVEWGEAEADEFANGILDLIKSIGDAFKQPS